MPLTPELHAHIREILKHLQSQGPNDPAVSYIVKATTGKLVQDKMLNVMTKYIVKKKGELTDGT